MNLEPNKVNYDSRENGIYQVAIAGTVKSISDELYMELSNSGYSLLDTDVLAIMINEVQYYASWAVLEVQRLSAGGVTLIGDSTNIHAYEWAILNPVVRAHCDLIQARLMESSRSLGGDGFGLTVSEANQTYLESRTRMQFEASYEPPFSIKTNDGN